MNEGCLVLGVIERRFIVCFSIPRIKKDEEENDIMLLLFCESFIRLLWVGLVFTRKEE